MEDNENKVSMIDVTVTGEVEIHSDPNVVKESVLYESDDINAVSYTHLDVYKRQV